MRVAAVSGSVNARPAEIIVIGGGVAGLAAAGELGRRGIHVELIEARDRLGGRILTERRRNWPHPVELGAQFVHAGNDALWSLLREHRIACQQVPERHWWGTGDGTVHPIDDVRARIAAVTGRIRPRRMRGWSFSQFLSRCGGELPGLDRQLVVGFVEGFEAAPCNEMSAAAVAGETLDDNEQYVLPGGYDQVVAALVAELAGLPVSIRLRSPVIKIEWRRGHVAVSTPERTWTGAAAVLTVPLGVLQAGRGQPGAVTFMPKLGPRERLLRAMRMGHVIRISLRFGRREFMRVIPVPLREPGSTGFGFIHSTLTVPVWWGLTRDPVLTGWCGGPGAQELANGTEQGIRRRAVASLGGLFHQPVSLLNRALRDVAIQNWSRDPFSRGAYSFTRAGWETAARQLREPVRRTLYFAGEATAEGEEIGTVHGALASGIRAAREVLAGA